MAGDCSEREEGEFGLEGLPQGERRKTVLRVGGKAGKAAGDCSELDNGKPGLEEFAAGRVPGDCIA